MSAVLCWDTGTTRPEWCRGLPWYIGARLSLPVHLLFCGVQAAWEHAKWTPSSDATLDPGWMLPVILLCRVYSAYLNTTPDAHMHRMQRPLPTEQLYSPDAPAAGLLPLLKFALWQVLWVEPITGDLTTLDQY